MKRGTNIKIIFALALFVFLPSSLMAKEPVVVNRVAAADTSKQLVSEAGRLIATLNPTKIAAGLRILQNEAKDAFEIAYDEDEGGKRKVAEQGPSSGAVIATFTSALMSGESGQQFARASVDVNGFAEDILSGKIKTETEAMKALGLKVTRLTEDQKEEADEIYASVISSYQGEDKKVVAEERKKQPMGQMTLAPVLDVASLSTDWNGSTLDVRVGQAEEKRPPAFGTYTGQQIRELLILVAPKAVRQDSTVAQLTAIKGRLSGMGVKMVRTHENIFEVARFNFKEYDLWRKQSGMMAREGR